MRASFDLPRPTLTGFVPDRPPFVRWLMCLLAVSVGAAAFGPGVARSSVAATIPTIYVDYTTDCTFTMDTDGGIGITSATAPGVVIPPGPYQVVISQDYALAPGAPRCPPSTLQLTGPSVSLSFVVGEGSPYEEATQTFPASSTFVAVVQDAPLAQLVFSTAATGSSTSLLGPSSSAPAGKGQTQSGLVGADAVPDRGTLRGTVGATGKVTLLFDGKSVARVKAGEYEIAVVDKSARTGFSVRKLHHPAVAISGVSFIGKRTRKIDLTAGTWSFSAAPGTARRFVVA